MMKLIVYFGIGFVVTLVGASPVAEKKALSFEDDPVGYVKEYIVGFLDSILNKDDYELSDDVKVTKNSYRSNGEETSRSNDDDYEDKVESYIKRHDVHFKLPAVGTVTVEARNLDSDELGLKVNFNQVEGRKSKLKKIFIPILVFVLLKAMTLVPLALGILSLKAWNALQLSFFSFVVAVGLAIFQLCKKIAADGAAPQIAAHEAWPAQQYYGRSLDGDGAQDLAYSAYV